MHDATAHRFSFGDKLVHPTKPEWGVGTVSKAAPDTHQGVSCQRVTVRFERGGLKTISTGVIALQPATEGGTADQGAPAPAAEVASAPADWLDEAGGVNPAEAMARLPEPATDPFSTPLQRLEATCALYRFTREPVALLDWAATQTGLGDPLTRFSRTELEEFFTRYEHARDAHLKSLVGEIRRTDPSGVDRVLSGAPKGVRAALKRGR